MRSNLSANEWLTVLYTAYYMESTLLLRRAMKVLESDPIMTGFPRLDVAQSISDVDWYKKSIFELATRKHPLNLAESEKLGMEMVVKVNDARSKWRDIKPRSIKDANANNIAEREIYGYIVELFKPEIDYLQ